jgi:hypothetical protein
LGNGTAIIEFGFSKYRIQIEAIMLLLVFNNSGKCQEKGSVKVHSRTVPSSLVGCCDVRGGEGGADRSKTILVLASNWASPLLTRVDT